MRNRQMIVRWIMAHTTAIEQRTRDGKTFFVMVDRAQFREGVGRLLAEVQRIKGEGRLRRGQRLFDTYGVYFDPALRDEVVARVDRLRLPSTPASSCRDSERPNERRRDSGCEHHVSRSIRTHAAAGVVSEARDACECSRK
jgi:hypothetical protein